MCNEVKFDINLKLTKFALKWVLTWRDSFIFKYCNHGKYVKFHLKMKRLHPRAGPSSRHMAIYALYHSYQDCPIDFHIRQSVPFHDHDIVPPTISWPVRYASVLSHNTHESYVCRAKCRVCGTVKSEVGQWIRINIGRARLKRNLDLISVFHCHCPRAQLLAAHTAAHQS